MPGLQEGRSSFLKKRSKKLLLMARRRVALARNPVRPPADKSFLVLFFKKEHLPSFPDLERVGKPPIQPGAVTSQTDPS
jgi:hypothetical protein